MRTLPGTDLTVSELCLGTAGFGSSIEEATAFSLLDAFTDRGGNFIDTARIYADGLGEEIIGKWLAAGGRSKAIVATKGGHYDHRGFAFSRVTRTDVIADVEVSLRKLRTDCIDFYWLHRDNTALPVGEIAVFCNDLVRDGKIRAWGISNWTLSRADEACKLGAKAVSNRFSLAHVESDGSADENGLVTTDTALYRWHIESGIPLVPYSALAFGFFEKLAAQNAPVADGGIAVSDLPKRLQSLLTPENARRYAQILQICAKYGCSVTDCTVGFHFAQPFPVFPVIAARTSAQLESLLAAGEYPFDPDRFSDILSYYRFV